VDAVTGNGNQIGMTMDTVWSILGTVVKYVVMIGLPLGVVALVLWIAFLRWSQMGVDL